jgi:simple sugar transport system ATP-binding protein
MAADLVPPLELIRAERVSKFYGRVQALDEVSVAIGRNEIVGFLGDNGAGKSTFIKILSGVTPLSSGQLYIKGQPVTISGTNDAIAHGIETIYQDSALVNQLSIARNLFLGREPLKGAPILGRLDRRFMDDVARRLMREVGITKDLPPSTPVLSLSGGERQAVAIARAMYFESELIILDEPTNNLGVAETQGVLRFVRNARDSGHSCIFIAHNIHHVFQVVDRIVVLRRGRLVADAIDPRTTTIEQVERVITGDLEVVDGELRPSAEARAAAAAAAAATAPDPSPPPMA